MNFVLRLKFYFSINNLTKTECQDKYQTEEIELNSFLFEVEQLNDKYQTEEFEMNSFLFEVEHLNENIS